MSIAARLEELGITLPQAPQPVAAYLPVVISGDTAYVSGQVPLNDGSLGPLGLVGKDLSQEQAIEAARVCAFNVLAQLQTALGSLDRVDQVLKLGVFVASDPSFHAQPLVANGASELLVDVFGDKGRHARSAVGVAVLPLNVPVEVDAIVRIKI